jgi:hypothetical protein
MALPQGDLALLDSEIARQLLASTLPARLAYVASDGTPRVLPTWFHWTSEELVMPTFIAAPHVKRPAARVATLRKNPDVAVTIDTEGFPPHVLLLRGRATVTDVHGVPAEYALAARRYLGDGAAATYLAQIDTPGTRMARIALRPAWVGIIDFEARMPGALGGITG